MTTRGMPARSARTSIPVAGLDQHLLHPRCLSCADLEAHDVGRPASPGGPLVAGPPVATRIASRPSAPASSAPRGSHSRISGARPGPLAPRRRMEGWRATRSKRRRRGQRPAEAHPPSEAQPGRVLARQIQRRRRAVGGDGLHRAARRRAPAQSRPSRCRRRGPAPARSSSATSTSSSVSGRGSAPASRRQARSPETRGAEDVGDRLAVQSPPDHLTERRAPAPSMPDPDGRSAGRGRCPRHRRAAAPRRGAENRHRPRRGRRPPRRARRGRRDAPALTAMAPRTRAAPRPRAAGASPRPRAPR